MLTEEEIKSFSRFFYLQVLRQRIELLSISSERLISLPSGVEKLQSNWELIPSAVAEILRFQAPVQGADSSNS